MSLVKIDGALFQAYISMGLSLLTAYDGYGTDGKVFDPPHNADWAAVSIVPATTNPSTLGDNGQDAHVGFMQIDFNTKPGPNRAVLIGYVQSVMTAFPAGKWFINSTQGVLIESVSRSPIRLVDGFLRVSATVNWIATTIRPEI